jgi:hypothetical protein
MSKKSNEICMKPLLYSNICHIKTKQVKYEKMVSLKYAYKYLMYVTLTPRELELLDDDCWLVLLLTLVIDRQLHVARRRRLPYRHWPPRLLASLVCSSERPCTRPIRSSASPCLYSFSGRPPRRPARRRGGTRA